MQKKIILYGSAQCPGCVMIKEKLDENGIKYGYVDVLGGLAHLKKFLAVRDAHPDVYGDIVTDGKVGIPTLVIDDERVVIPGEDFDLQQL